MISKIGCRSLANLFKNFLAIKNDEKIEIKEDYIEQRKEILDKMMQEFKTNTDFEVIFLF